MSIINLTEITWKEFENLEKEKTIGTIVLSPIEEHGLHLPLGTDYIIANDIFLETIKRLDKKNSGYNYLIYPSFAIGYNNSISNFPGTFCFRINTIKEILIDLIENYIRNNVKKIIIFNHHLDLGQIKAIQEVKQWIMKKNKVVILDITSSIMYSENRLESHEEETEIHADIRETSFMLYRYPEKVKTIYKNLPEKKLDIKNFFREGKTYFTESGITDGYIGNPAQATYEIGEKNYENMINEILTVIDEYIEKNTDFKISKKIQSIFKFIR
ncbi:MAG: creatininase family protein [Fusobacteriaceae bacterium]|nr:creatininase family protein [Fusobacteriaceae bacterium]